MRYKTMFSMQKEVETISHKDNDSGFGLLGLLAIGGLFAWVHNEAKKEREESERHKAETARRKNTPCNFEDGISEEDFSRLALKVCKKIKRVKNASVRGPFLYGKVESQSGLSTWDFSVDFNDYGHITGNYWVTSGNVDSNIPARIGELISQAIALSMNSDSNNQACEQYHDDIELEDDSYVETEVSSVPPSQCQKKRRLKIRTVIIITFIICVMGLFAYNCWIVSKLITVGFSSFDFVGEYYLDVIDSLSEAGFTKIHVNELNDLSYAQIEKEGVVVDVSINGETTYFSTSKYPFDSEIVVTLHSLKYISAPITSKEAKGTAYYIVREDFISAGFGNVVLTPKEDIVLGWFAKDGEVDSIAIDGNRKYTEKDLYRPDVEVVITYHTRKSK
ncbi:MAG: hypothetical protein E7432_06240 [Ruminococcaceae bacterium]|nr:hypothetical protein [Oscillospiraceae bacterium]